MLCPTRFVVEATENSEQGGVGKAKGESKLGRERKSTEINTPSASQNNGHAPKIK